MNNQTPFIQNISRKDIELGNHAPTSPERTILIQISDVGREQPIPTAKFKHIYQFIFDDIDNPDNKALMEEFNVRSVPTVVVDDDGLIRHFVGPTLTPEFLEAIK